MRLAYCPACLQPLDQDDRCWGVCALAGISQPPIHFADFTYTERHYRDGCGNLVRVTVQPEMVRRKECV